jgi:uncharacterized protein YcbX
VTEGTVRVKSISIYPIKSLDPVDVTEARVLPSGALEYDREFALFDDAGKRINGKRDARIHRIRATYDLEDSLVTLSADDLPPETFHLTESRRQIEAWVGGFLGLPVFLQRDTQTGFPDDLECPGPTIVGSATLGLVASWFNSEDLQATARRFRANVEISCDTPFWEDRLFGSAETIVEFRIGDVLFHGVNPCQRCAVPSRDPQTGEVTADFQRLFAEKRERMLPPWATKSRFSHYYRLAVNTRIPESEAGKAIHVGDLVSL